MNEILLQTDFIKKALAKLSVAVNAKSVLPVLENILFRVDNSKVSLITTDLEMMVIYEHSLDSKEIFDFLVPFKQLATIVKVSTNDELIFQAGEKSVKILSGLDVYELDNSDSPADFPSVEWSDSEGFELESIFVPFLLTALDSTSSVPMQSISKVLLSIKKNGITIVATDGYVLYKWSNPMQNDIEYDLLLSGRAIKSMEGEDAISIKWNDNKYFIAAGNVKTIITKSEGKYPAYESVIPTYPPNLQVNRKGLLVAFQKCTVATDVMKDVTLEFSKDKIRLSVLNATKGIKVNGEVECTYTGSVNAITLNIDNAIRLLHQVDSPWVMLAIEAHNRAILMTVQESGYLGLIIPTFNK